MSDLAVSVEGLGKLYRIGQRERYYTLRDTIAQALTVPFRWLSRRRNMNTSLTPRNGRSESIWALKNVSFDIKRGEVVGVIGRNGAGKSTLLKILSRITEPTEGEARVYGRVGSLLEVGTGFHAELTGRENIYLNGAILGMKKKEIERNFDAIVAFAEVEKFIDTPVKHYSSGMYMRLAFAVAAHLEPEILIVDEVLAVGDAAFQKKCLGKMGEVAKEGRTVLFVSHDMAAIGSMCQRGVVLDGGQRGFDGNTKEAIDHYLSIVSGNLIDDVGFINRSAAEKSSLIRFCEVVFFDADTAAQLKTLCSGKSIHVRIKYAVIDSAAIGKRLKVGVGFFDSFGQTKFAINNEAVNVDMYVTAEGVVEFLIPRFPLSEGHYYCSLYSSVDDVTADWVRLAISVTVVKGDFYGSGKLPGGNEAMVYVPYQWIR